MLLNEKQKWNNYHIINLLYYATLLWKTKKISKLNDEKGKMKIKLMTHFYGGM